MKITTFETAKVGDRVLSIEYGWGFICAIETEDNFPVKVIFDELEESYLYSGASLNKCSQTLFWDEVKIEAPVKPMPDIAVDAKVLVWEDGSRTKYCRHFSHFKNNNIYVFDKGLSSWTTTVTSGWANWELAE